MPIFKRPMLSYVESALERLRLVSKPGKPAPVEKVTNEVVVAIPYAQNRGKMPEFDVRLYIDEGYRRNVVAHACISVLASAASEPEMVVRTSGDDQEILPPEHPISRLIRAPNPNESMKELLERIIIDINAAGHCYIHKGRNSSGQVIRLQRLRPDYVFPIPGDNIGEILGYEFKPMNGARDQIIETGDIIRISLVDPLEEDFGLSPLMVAAKFINIHGEAGKYLQDYFLNGAVPAGFVVIKSGPIDPAERQRVMNQFMDTYGRGSSSDRDRGNWHRWGVIGGDVDFKQIAPDLDKLRLDDVWGIAESNICSAFRVPAVLVQAKIGLQRNTYSSHREARTSLWEDTLPPQFNRIRAAFNRSLVIGETNENIEIAFDFDQVSALQESEDLKIDRAAKKYAAGVISRNEARTLTGDPLFDEDYIVIPQGAIKVDENGVAVPPETPEPGSITPDGRLVPHVPPPPGSPEAIAHMTAQAKALQAVKNSSPDPEKDTKDPKDPETQADPSAPETTRAEEDRDGHEAGRFRETQGPGDAERLGHAPEDPRVQEVSRRVEEGLRAARASVDVDELERAFATGDVSEVMRVLDRRPMEGVYSDGLSGVLGRLIQQIGTVEYPRVQVHGEGPDHPFRGNQYTGGIVSADHIMKMMNASDDNPHSRRLADTISRAMETYATGDVPNARYLDIKSSVGRMLETSFKATDNMVYSASDQTKSAMWAKDTGITMLESPIAVNSMVKKISKELAKGGHSDEERSIYEAMLAKAEEVKPVIAAIESMKARAVKRQPKPPEDRTEKYVAPMAKTESGKIVIDALKGVTDSVKSKYEDSVNNIIIDSSEHVAGIEGSSAQRKADFQGVLSLPGMWDFAPYPRQTYTLKPNYKDTARKIAKETADQMQSEFIQKNAQKMASIIDRKSASLDGPPHVDHVSVGHGGTLSSRMRFKFKDSSAFTVVNKVVTKFSSGQKWFRQYPTTFHDVVLKNGSKMPLPSEKRMNEVFAVDNGDETHGEGPGHPFRGNQYTSGVSFPEEVPNRFTLSAEEQLQAHHRGQALADESSMTSLPPGKAVEITKMMKTEFKTTQAQIEHRYRKLLDDARGTEAWNRGLEWYGGVNEWCAEKAAEHNSSPEVVAGVLAAMSPGMRWDDEQPIADFMLAAANGSRVKLSQEHIDGVVSKIVPDPAIMAMVRSGATYKDLHAANPSAATLVMRQQFIQEDRGGWSVGYSYDNFEGALSVAMKSTTPDEALGGIKTRSFFNNMMDPKGSRDVTCDVLMAEAAINRTGNAEKIYTRPGSSKVGVAGGKSIKYGAHPMISDVVRKIADSEGLPVPMVQAIIWSQWRATHSASSKAQETKRAARRKLNAEGLVAANLARSINQAKKKKAEKHSESDGQVHIPVMVEYPESPLFPEWFYTFLEIDNLPDQIVALDAADEAGLLPDSGEAHGESSGHPFRGNQWTGGKGGSGKMASARPWSYEDPRSSQASDAMDTLQNMWMRKVDERPAVRPVRLGFVLTLDPSAESGVGPRRWSSVLKQANEIKSALADAGLDRDKLIKALSPVEYQGGTPSDYFLRKVDRYIANGEHASEALDQVIKNAEAAKAAASKSSRDARADRAVKESATGEKLPGISDVKVFKTAKEAAASISDITWDSDKHPEKGLGYGLHTAGPKLNIDKMDNRLASLVVDELRSLHDEFPKQFSELGYVGMGTSRNRVTAMAVYSKEIMNVGFDLGAREHVISRAGVTYIYNSKTREERPFPEGGHTMTAASIAFNGPIFTSAVKAYKVHGVESESDFHDGMKDIRSTVAHEFAHHLDKRATDTGFKGLNRWKAEWYMQSAKEVSGYSRKNAAEFLAEAFAASRYGDATRKSHPAVKALTSVLNEFKAYKPPDGK